jgi:hypothetical protein
MYTAAVLTDVSANLLKWMVRALTKLEEEGFVFQTEQGNPLPHHMTINLGAFDHALNDVMTTKGCPIKLTVEEIVYNHVIGVCAAPVVRAEGIGEDDIKTANAVPHITLCIKPGSKPMLSNKMLESPNPHTVRIKLDAAYVLESVGEEVN